MRTEPALATLALALVVAPTRAAATDTSVPPDLELAARPAVKITVRTTGWTRVSQPALVAAGLDPGVDPGGLRLFADGVEHAMNVTGNGDARLDPDESIEFFGVARDTLSTDARTYWLVAGATTGKRVPLVVYPGSSAAPDSFLATTAMRDRKVYYAPLRNGDDSNFFAAFVDSNGVSETVRLLHVADATTARIRIVLQGVTVGTHAVAVTLNGQPLGTCGYEGQTLSTCALSPGQVLEGDNQLGLVSTGVAPDYSLLSEIDVDYAHAFRADGDRLALTAPPATRVAIAGFSSPSARVFDVSDPVSPIELVTGMSTDGAAYTASANTAGATSPRSLWAVADGQIPAPAAVAANRPSHWGDPLEGELVVLSNAAFIDAIGPLVARRAQEGWTVQLVDLQDVYDGFSGGDKDPAAIRDFLAMARVNWRVPPRFALLVGDASFDPRNFLGLGDYDFAPTKLIDSASLETASDDWFVDFDEDGLLDLAIGRIPVRTAAEATTVVGKLLAYAGTSDLTQGALFVTDPSEDGLDFQAASQQGAAALAGLLPADSLVIDQTAATASTLIQKLDAGPFLVDYTGHGSVAVWDGAFSGTDAAALTNSKLSIYVAMNCLNGLFQDLYTESLAETLLKAPQGGAVAVWASSTLGSFDPQSTLNAEFLRRLTRTSLGEAAVAAKHAVTDPDARRTWILFGDPTLFGRPTPLSDGGTEAGTGGDGATDGGTPGGDGGVGPDGPGPDASSDGGGADAPRDSGRDGGPTDGPAATDGPCPADAAGPDAGAPAAPGGCSCRLAGDPANGVWLGLPAILALARRRRRTRRTQAYAADC